VPSTRALCSSAARFTSNHPSNYTPAPLACTASGAFVLPRVYLVVFSPGGTDGTISNAPALILPNQRLHSMLPIPVQPPISTIPCKIVYSLANLMLLFPMFSSPAASPTNHSPLPRPFPPHRCHPERSEGPASRVFPRCTHGVSAFSALDVSPFNVKLLIVNCHSRSPLPATLTSRVNLNPFVCHSYRKHPGWGYILQPEVFTLHTLTTHCSLLSTNSLTIRISAKRAPNSHRIRTSKTQDLRPFRMRSYKKTGEGGGAYC
jgi:hypothetical protein